MTECEYSTSVGTKCVLSDEVAALTAQLSQANARVAELEQQLPPELSGRTIRFKECAVGHGWLTATNWIQHGCPHCELSTLRAQLREAQRALEVVMAALAALPASEVQGE